MFSASQLYDRFPLPFPGVESADDTWSRNTTAISAIHFFRGSQSASFIEFIYLRQLRNLHSLYRNFPSVSEYGRITRRAKRGMIILDIQINFLLCFFFFFFLFFFFFFLKFKVSLRKQRLIPDLDSCFQIFEIKEFSSFEVTKLPW